MQNHIAIDGFVSHLVRLAGAFVTVAGLIVSIN
jgi:hypothetical protein